MIIKKYICIALAALLLVSCGGGQSIFYWERENTGAVWFARDHNQCLDEADWWPWSWPAWRPGTQKRPNLRFDNNAENGIWANYVPYSGAQPVYVNSLNNDSTMSASSYKRCMLERGYQERRPMEKRKQVLPE